MPRRRRLRASCQQLSGVLETWRAINAQDLPRLNAELATRKLPALPVATTVPTIACGPADREADARRQRSLVAAHAPHASLPRAVTMMLCDGQSCAARARRQRPPSIQHIVVIFQENVSFDHYFATYPHAANLPGEPAFTPLPGTPPVAGLSGDAADGESELHQPANGADAVNPYRLSRSQAATADQDHSYTQEQIAYDHGKMDLFPATVGQCVATDGSLAPQANKSLNLAYFDGNTVTAIWNYAQRFAMSDHFFQATFGPSVLGALNLVSGQTNGVTRVKNGASPNVLIDGGAGSFTVIGDVDPIGDICSSSKRIQVTMGGRNIGDLLNAANVSWGWFEAGFDVKAVNDNGSTGCTRAHTSAVTGLSSNDYVSHHEPFQVLPVDRQPHARPADVGGDDRPERRRGESSVRSDGLLRGRRCRTFSCRRVSQAARLPERPRRVLRSDRRAGVPRPRAERSAAASGVEEHGRVSHVGRFRRLVRPPDGADRQFVGRSDRRARRRRDLRRRHGDPAGHLAGESSRAGAVRLRAASAAAGDFAVGEDATTSIRRSRTDVDRALHRRRLSRRPAHRRRIVRRDRRRRSITCSTSRERRTSRRSCSTSGPGSRRYAE